MDHKHGPEPSSVLLSLSLQKILAKKGQKTIQHVRKSSKDTKRATAAMTLTACGHWLPSMIIFMGWPHDMIAIRELRKNDCLSSYGRQDNAWMDKQCGMLKWMRKNIIRLYPVVNPPLPAPPSRNCVCPPPWCIPCHV